MIKSAKTSIKKKKLLASCKLYFPDTMSLYVFPRQRKEIENLRDGGCRVWHIKHHEIEMTVWNVPEPGAASILEKRRRWEPLRTITPRTTGHCQKAWEKSYMGNLWKRETQVLIHLHKASFRVRFSVGGWSRLCHLSSGTANRFADFKTNVRINKRSSNRAFSQHTLWLVTAQKHRWSQYH